jgi:hypothetical protein
LIDGPLQFSLTVIHEKTLAQDLIASMDSYCCGTLSTRAVARAMMCCRRGNPVATDGVEEIIVPFDAKKCVNAIS